MIAPGVEYSEEYVFCVFVDASERLIQNEDRCLCGECAGNKYAFLLSTG
ncbi:DUF2769 domain-containing protein [Corynebacterium kroppenstedtii]